MYPPNLLKSLIVLSSLAVTGIFYSSSALAEGSCIGNFSDSWVIHTSQYENDQGVTVKSGDVLNVFCAPGDDRYTIVLERGRRNGEDKVWEICPGNGQVIINESNSPLLACSIWDHRTKQVKTLSLELMDSPLAGDDRSLFWYLDDETPDVSDPFGGNPESEADTAGNSRT